MTKNNTFDNKAPKLHYFPYLNTLIELFFFLHKFYKGNRLLLLKERYNLFGKLCLPLDLHLHNYTLKSILIDFYIYFFYIDLR